MIICDAWRFLNVVFRHTGWKTKETVVWNLSFCDEIAIFTTTGGVISNKYVGETISGWVYDQASIFSITHHAFQAQPLWCNVWAFESGRREVPGSIEVPLSFFWIFSWARKLIGTAWWFSPLGMLIWHSQRQWWRPNLHHALMVRPSSLNCKI